jgi:hypothetical protein
MIRSLLDRVGMAPWVQQKLDRVRIVPWVQQKLLYWSYGPRYRAWRAANPCPKFPNREALHQYLVDHEGLGGPIDYLEFGVFQGASIAWWIEHNRDPGSTFTGFDSFAGLPERWNDVPTGTFATNGRPPEIPDPRCRWVQGWFKDTLPGWLAAHAFGRRVVIHMDADLYSSTLLVLVHLLPRLRPADVVMFDNFLSYLHEFRALTDALAACPRTLQIIGSTESYGRHALKVV